ncbi:hypothetical protein OG562_39130 [Streptomyces sp. NBC_01275]|uniref:hypothetical protein n=1 Tax=Streptomyces sp. NBC_01275 TaxID=2903807 RepID=UPI00224EEF73|nr:hypothetical protein [Streptomyces sp. NBC_01275]MCX4766880.1 hypothetical protein [Streptomyces sp. NBC_01275]
MRTLRRPSRPAVRRLWITAVTAAVAATLGAAPLATAAPAVPLAPQDTTAAVTRAPQPYLFNFEFNKHLRIAGGNFTLGGRVYLAVKFNTGRIAFERTVFAEKRLFIPGGGISVETTIASPCAPGNNGYAQAYDWSTRTWSPRLPVPICVRFD